ncbi:MAG: hypothetical protein ACLRWU_11385, partial [Ruminococcus sp.]
MAFFLLSELNAAGGVFVLPKKKRNPFYFGRNAGLNPLFNVPSPRPVTRRDGHCPSWLFYYQNLTPQGEFLYYLK